MRIRLPTAPPAYGLEVPSAGVTVDILHLRNPKTCPNKPGHFWRKTITSALTIEERSLLGDWLFDLSVIYRGGCASWLN